MRRVLLPLVLVGVCALGLPSVAYAQSRPQPRPAPPGSRTAPKKQPIGFRAYGFYDFEVKSASQTFTAVTGSSIFNGFGGGFEVTNLWKNVFARLTVSYASKSGQRVFVNNNTVFPLGIPLTVSMTPIEVAAGWRQTVDRRGLYSAYAGGGAMFLAYSETSTQSIAGEDTSQTFGGFTLFGGFDRGFHKNLFVGAEAMYRGVPSAIGTAGVSQIYGETNLGGFAVRVLFGFKR